MKGRRPKSPYLRLVGAPSHKAKDKRTAPKVAADLPHAPGWLSADARAQWDTLAPTLHSAGLLTQLDAILFGVYCSMQAQWIAAQKHLDTEGATVSLPSGIERPSPWHAITTQLAPLLLRMGEQFGLTPASRQRLKVELPRDDDENSFRKFLRQGESKAPNPWVAPKVRRKKREKPVDPPVMDAVPSDLPPVA